jgi:glycine betaine catabolism B
MLSLIRKPLDYIDSFLDQLTSYRLVLYFLVLLVGFATVFSFSGQLSYDGFAVLASAVWLCAVCWLVNTGLAQFLKIYKNRESDLISALILCLILPPPTNLKDYLILASAGVAAVASKFILTFGKRHILNPAAFGAFAVGAIFHTYPSWWIGTAVLTPIVVAGGLLILRKMQRFIMVGLFIAVYLTVLVYSLATGDSSTSLIHGLWLGLIGTPILFFGFVMLTEPLTSPRQLSKYIPFTLLVGILYSVSYFGLSPEEALLIGNVFAYLLAPTRRLELDFLKKRKLAEGIYSFSFSSLYKLKYQPGQYLEWTLPSAGSDSRGNRRYLTLSSSPTEKNYSFAIKIPHGRLSSFKKSVAMFEPGDRMLAGSIAGSFTLPKDSTQKLVFVAGGIGVTPYRSIVKYLLDTKQNRDILLIYSANLPEEFAYGDIFEEAKSIGLKTSYVVTSQDIADSVWRGKKGKVNKKLLASEVPDWPQRTFYISGPLGFVNSTRQALRAMGVAKSAIKTDTFSGYN